MTELFANGVRVGDWFHTKNNNWLHFHPEKHSYNNYIQWTDCVDGACSQCDESVPKQVKMHAELQRLKNDSIRTNCEWPVRAK